MENGPTRGEVEVDLQKEDFGWSFNLSSSVRSVLVTTAIGEEYFKNWSRFSASTWIRYAQRHNLGVAVVTEIPADFALPPHLNGAWAKLVAPEIVWKTAKWTERFLLIDTDILIAPSAPNIFESVPEGRFGVVSQERTPYPRGEIRRRIAFFRNRLYSADYPLDSILHAEAREIFLQQGLPPHDDYFCSGMVVLGSEHFTQLRTWIDSVEAQVAAASFAWEEPFLNDWIQSSEPVWLDYRFQAIWVFEMAWKYPFLYEFGSDVASQHITARCVESNLLENYFLHFAGSWFESSAWKCETFGEGSLFALEAEFEDFLRAPLTGKAVGKVLPNSGARGSKD